MSETISLPSIAILGAGSMGGAVLRGLVQPGVEVDGGITVTNRTITKAEALAELPGVTSIALEQDADGNRRAAAAADPSGGTAARPRNLRCRRKKAGNGHEILILARFML